MRRLGYETFGLIFGLAYVMVGTSALFTLTTLPLFATIYFFDPTQMVAIVATEAVLLFPAASGAFGVFQRYSKEGDTSVIRNYFKAWYESLKRSVLIGVATVILLTLFGAEFVFLWATQRGVLIAPVLVVSAGITATVAFYSLAINSTHPQTELKGLLKAALYVPFRHPILLTLCWMALLALGALVISYPAVALGVAVGPTLYLVWSNVRLSVKASIARSRIKPLTTTKPNQDKQNA